MPPETTLTRDAFLCLAAKAGLDVRSAHMDDLYPVVENSLAGLKPLDEVDVGGAEPDMVFMPHGG